jgi:hypothetical protein
MGIRCDADAKQIPLSLDLAGLGRFRQTDMERKVIVILSSDFRHVYIASSS